MMPSRTSRLVLATLAVVANFTVLVSCTKPKTPEPPTLQDWGEYRTSPNREGQFNNISLSALYRELGIDGLPRQLGYQEKSFNACTVKANRSSSPSCQKLYLGTLHFLMTCRNNPGIVQSSQLLPLKLSGVKWRAGGDRGMFFTEPDGRGTIRFVSRSTARFRPMKFYIGRKIVYKRLKDNWKIILPRDWCPAQQTL